MCMNAGQKSMENGIATSGFCRDTCCSGDRTMQKTFTWSAWGGCKIGSLFRQGTNHRKCMAGEQVHIYLLVRPFLHLTMHLPASASGNLSTK